MAHANLIAGLFWWGAGALTLAFISLKIGLAGVRRVAEGR